MDCRQVDRLLEANLDGRLSGFERMALRQHLRACRVCRAKVDAMSAFAESVERTLACADGPDWERLAPPPPAPERAGPRVGPESRTPVSRTPALRRLPPRRRPWGALGFLLAGAALVALALPLASTPEPRARWLDEALAVEATRLAGGGRVDLETEDLDAALRWLGARGLPSVPPFGLADSITLEGAFLAYYAERRVGGLALRTPDGRVAVHLHDATHGDTARRPHRAGGLEATTTSFGDWRLVVIAPEGTSAGSTVVSGLTGAAVPAAL